MAAAARRDSDVLRSLFDDATQLLVTSLVRLLEVSYQLSSLAITNRS